MSEQRITDDDMTPEQADQMYRQLQQRTEKQQFIAMLYRAGIGHGLRVDYNPPGIAVMVESGENAVEFMVTEFGFDSDGKLKTVACYPGEEG